MDITPTRPHRTPFQTQRSQEILFLLELAITIVSTVRALLLISAFATRIVQRRTAEQRAGTLAAFTAFRTTADTIILPAAKCVQRDIHITVCMTRSTVLGKCCHYDFVYDSTACIVCS